METITVTKVSYTDKKKDGTQIVSKNGKPMYRTGIQTQEYGDMWINGFLPFIAKDWEGQKKELIITDDTYNGNPIKRFELPQVARPTAQANFDSERLKKMDEKLDRILIALNAQTPGEKVEATRDQEPPEIDF